MDSTTNRDEIIRHVTKHIGPVEEDSLGEIVPASDVVSVTVNVVLPAPGRECITLFTTGMSDRPMTVPEGGEEYRYAELLMRLPPDWPLAKEAFDDANVFWPFEWLRNIAYYPHENETWLGGIHTIIANGEPPEPLAPNTELSCLLLLTDPSEAGQIRRSDGTVVNFYAVVPIHTEERDLEVRDGTARLLDLFEEQGVSSVVDVDRPSVAGSGPGPQFNLFDDVLVLGDEVRTVSAAEVERVAGELGGAFPPGYLEYATRLGKGRLYGTFDVYLPAEVLQQREAFRDFWEEVQELEEEDEDEMQEEQRQFGLRCVPLGETTFNEYFVFDPADPEKVYLVGNIGSQQAGSSLPEAIEGYIAECGFTSVLDFVPAGVERETLFLNSGQDFTLPDVFDALTGLNLHDASSRDDENNVHLALYFKGICGTLELENNLTAEFVIDRDQKDHPVVGQILACLQRLGYELFDAVEEEDEQEPPEPVEISPRAQELFDEHGAAAFDKQLRLQDLIGDEDWEFDMETGQLSFADAHAWNAQILGTESEVSGTWLWGWANEAGGIPGELLQAARTLKEQLGGDEGLEEFARPSFAVDDRIDGHFLASIASGITAAGGYYRGPYEGGAVFLLIDDETLPPPIENPLLRLSTVFPQAIANLPITDHRQALCAYAAFLGLAFEEEGQRVVIRNEAGGRLTADFDEQGRLTGLSGNVS